MPVSYICTSSRLSKMEIEVDSYRLLHQFLILKGGGFKSPCTQACKLLVWTSMSTSNFIFQSRTSYIVQKPTLASTSIPILSKVQNSHIDLKSHISKARTSLEAYIDFNFHLWKPRTYKLCIHFKFHPSQSGTSLQAYIEFEFRLSKAYTTSNSTFHGQEPVQRFASTSNFSKTSLQACINFKIRVLKSSTIAV